MAALTLLRHCELDLPFIVVSGTIDEEIAVTILKAGAHDFVTTRRPQACPTYGSVHATQM